MANKQGDLVTIWPFHPATSPTFKNHLFSYVYVFCLCSEVTNVTFNQQLSANVQENYQSNTDEYFKWIYFHGKQEHSYLHFFQTLDVPLHLGTQ